MSELKAQTHSEAPADVFLFFFSRILHLVFAVAPIVGEFILAPL